MSKTWSETPTARGFLGHCMTPSSRNPRRAAPVSLERELEARGGVRMQLHVGKGVLAHRRRERPRLGRFARLCLTRRVLGVQVRQRRTRRASRRLCGASRERCRQATIEWHGGPSKSEWRGTLGSRASIGPHPRIRCVTVLRGLFRKAKRRIGRERNHTTKTRLHRFLHSSPLQEP